ncbi:carotenoid biosynthesis protein [Nocardia thailandica]|uniref:Carotenoid biosynthesis protein n=1 Tax=Nocardia thailandica TaxID=257275 RepID=A0ABW6PIS4_9NOCA
MVAAATRWWRADRARRVPAVLAALLVLTQIAYPLTAGPARDHVTVAVVCLSAAAALTHAAATRGFGWAAGFLVIVSGLGLTAEVIGTATGHPFGCYSYAAGRIGPALADVPLVVPLAWTGGLYPIWIVAGMLAARPPARVALLVAGALGWDLFLDPQMVADGQWTWCDTGSGLPGIPEIPLTNYLGWALVATLMGLALTLLERWRPPGARNTVAVPVALFLWTWLGSALAHAVFLGLPASAAWGLAGLAPLGVPLLWRRTRAGRHG